MENHKSFLTLIKEIDEKKHEQRDRGTLFELLVAAYLKTEPVYARLFDAVWTLSEVPQEYNIPKFDTGVDLVAKKRDTNELVAVQCKFYSKDTIIQKRHIDSFLNEIGKNYYSEGLIVTTTDKWSKNADEALKFRNKDIMRISLSDLADSRIDWSAYSFREPKEVVLKERKTPRIHQKPAIKAVIDGFQKADRGKLIMAPGTGKTYTSMAIAEEMAKEKNGVFKVLYLVPSIQLLSQTLRSWNADIDYNMDSIAVCSDRKVTKENAGNELEDIAAADLGYPATTDASKLLKYQEQIENSNRVTEFITVFSTYQSLDVIIEAQQGGFYEFDLIVCDEAHRTTGATELNKEASAFTKVHSNDKVRAKKRLYQTATPRVYGEDAKEKAAEKSVLIADMNDPEIYGEEFYRIGFGDAIRNDILTDYKVMVLAVDEEVIARRFQQMLANETELEFDDVTKIIGCWNGLVKRNGNTNQTLGAPMKRAIAFTGTIRDSKLITDMFSRVVEEYIHEKDDYSNPFSIEIEHADGSMNAVQKNEKINWLKSEVPDYTCRVLSNARFLTEGVDVPDLDAIMFLKPRRSKIDIAQAVGRVMRKAPGKDYGYIILPIGVPAGVDANTALDNNEKYRVVWEVLNALRSLDERFDATINKLELNKKKPNQVQIIGVGDAPDGNLETPSRESEQMAFNLSEEELTDLEKAIYGKIVNKVGNVRYWEQWSEDVADIARKHIMRINIMLEDKDSDAYKEFKKFVTSLHHNINDSISEQQAIEMLSQHLITKPIFEALFNSYSFVNNNPVSHSMEEILNILDKQGLMKEQKKLEDFYESVRTRAEGIDNLEAKQKIIIQLYDKFFKVGFKDTTERLGIVFTPVEAVDFIIQSVEDILQKYFGKSISTEGVHILDPFTGTGTFMTRLLQSGLIPKEDLARKYMQELHANEIVLLSYYIAAINIEETYHSIIEGDYVPFEGIVMTDTFESTESDNSFNDKLFEENNYRLEKQKKEPIFAIIGNPPYSAKQSSENDNNQNQKYPILDGLIRDSYAKYSTAQNKNNLYDSYIRSFKWASERIKESGVIGFVTNSGFLDGITADGLRKCWYEEEFNYIYILNLRGDARTQGEQRKKEAGNIFASGSRTGVAITLLVKDGSNNHEIYYNDIGDYLNRKEKLAILKDKKSINSLQWERITPDSFNNWINQRDDKFMHLKPITDDEDSVFIKRGIGFGSSRDEWVTNYSLETLEESVNVLISNFNDQIKNVTDSKNLLSDSTKINWSDDLKKRWKKKEKITYEQNAITVIQYRPFVKKYLYNSKPLIKRPSIWNKVFGEGLENNLFLNFMGGDKGFSVLVTNQITDYQTLFNNKSIPLYFVKEDEESLFDESANKLENIRDKTLSEFQSYYNDNTINKLSIFYYVYALLSSKDYQERFRADLMKESPRILYTSDFWQYAEVGEKLVKLHIDYENVEPYKGNIDYKNPNPSYEVTKMKYTKRGDTSSITFNTDIVIKDIPVKAQQYKVNGRTPMEWIMEQYKLEVKKNSQIVFDPNRYSPNDKYIFNLLLSAINVSIQTVDLINSLPPLEIED